MRRGTSAPEAWRERRLAIGRVNVALVAPLVSPIADPFLGGSQAVLYDLATALAQRGHGVSFFAADGSRVPGVELVTLGIDSTQLRPAQFSPPHRSEKALRERERAYFLRIAYEIKRRAADFDVVHNHAFDAPPLELLSQVHRRVIHTLHLPPLVPDVIAAAREAAAAGARLVTVSAWAARDWQGHVGPTTVVHNGVPLANIPMGRGPREGWLFVGRIAPEKGLEDALTAAERAGKRLRVIGGVYDQTYYERVLPRLRAHDVVGPIPRDAVFAQMAAAMGLLMPAGWDEPFGLTAVEAMAAGTPVAAYARGALPELIEPGRTGYLVSAGDVEGLVEAARKFGAIDPDRCRQWVSERFDLQRMVQDYLRLYES